MSKEAMKLALEALERYMREEDIPWSQTEEAITALREALAGQPAQQKPVAWRIRCTDPMRDWVLMYRHPRTEEQFSNMEIQPLYTSTPAQCRPLTPAEVHGMAEAHGIDGDARHWYVIGLVDAQAKHNIKEQP